MEGLSKDIPIESPGESTTQPPVLLVPEQTTPSTDLKELNINDDASDSAVEEKPGDEAGMWNWFKTASSNPLVQKVMETTKTSVDCMITTLDPGMTPYLREGGDIDVAVTSDKEVKWFAVRDAFQKVFGSATVRGIDSQPNIAPQPVGCLSGFKGAQERIENLINSSKVDKNQVCVSVENFIAEQLPNRWFDIGCLILKDPVNNIELEVFTLAVPVPSEVIAQMKEATPSNYDLKESGFSMTVGEAFQKEIPWVTPYDWHKALVGKSRRDIIFSAAITLAELYKRRLPGKEMGQDI